jgi:hypothetical protein
LQGTIRHSTARREWEIAQSAQVAPTAVRLSGVAISLAADRAMLAGSPRIEVEWAAWTATLTGARCPSH